MFLFRDREAAGRQLGRALEPLKGKPDVRVLALPRGGVPVARAVARALGAPLDLLTVRKLALPSHPETAVGALASGGVEVLHATTLRRLGLTREDLSPLVDEQRRELIRREKAYRLSDGPPDVAGRVVVLVDDGLATGASMGAAVQAVRGLGAARVVVAVPLGPADTCAFLAEQATLVCLYQPQPFEAVGAYYEDFHQLSDTEVLSLLQPDARH